MNAFADDTEIFQQTIEFVFGDGRRQFTEDVDLLIIESFDAVSKRIDKQG